MSRTGRWLLVNLAAFQIVWWSAVLGAAHGLPWAGPLTALAGKGIVFDSGGVNLKRDLGELSWMKSDMAAAASVAFTPATAVPPPPPIPAVTTPAAPAAGSLRDI